MVLVGPWAMFDDPFPEPPTDAERRRQVLEEIRALLDHPASGGGPADRVYGDELPLTPPRLPALIHEARELGVGWAELLRVSGSG